jgi:hypothetical protein
MLLLQLQKTLVDAGAYKVRVSTALHPPWGYGGVNASTMHKPQSHFRCECTTWAPPLTLVGAVRGVRCVPSRGSVVFGRAGDAPSTMQHTNPNVHDRVRVLVAQGTTHSLFSQQPASEGNFLCA